MIGIHVPGMLVMTVDLAIEFGVLLPLLKQVVESAPLISKLDSLGC